MSIVLRDYQENGTNELIGRLAAGARKLVFQLSTGGGKTVIFSYLCKRYTDKSDKSVVIMVHRKELLRQTRNALWKYFNIDCSIIASGVKYIKPAKVYVCMVESLRTRINKIPTKVGMVVIDESHISNFNKLHKHFPAENATTTDAFAGTGEPYIIGFTATPQSASKKDPMKNHYQDIVCGADIEHLIKIGSLVQNITRNPQNLVDRGALAIKNGEFDESKMAQAFSKPKHIENTVKTYQKYTPGTKAIIFNCNIDHSVKVNTAFRLAGLPSKHLDSTMSKTERDNIIRWFETTPGAILNNVGIATTGTDIPSVETVIMNKSTLSMPLWLQCCGRGARPYPNKAFFSIIDMGGNALAHGDWCDPRDWYNIFHNPAKPKEKEGVAPVKSCPQCDAIISASANICKHCGYVFPAKEIGKEEELGDFVIVTKGIDVHKLIETNKEKKQYYTFYKIGRDLAKGAKNTVPEMTDENANFILQKCEGLTHEWCKESKKKFDQWHKNQMRENLFMELHKKFPKWESDLWQPAPPPVPPSMPEHGIPIWNPPTAPVPTIPQAEQKPFNPFYIEPLKSL